MKFTIKKATGLCVGALLAACPSSYAHPGLSEEDKKAPCPFMELQHQQHRNLRAEGWKQPPMRALGAQGDGGIPEGGFESVKADLEELMTKSEDYWPADEGHYGGFFIRLAWHCSGSYRRSDGRGGCDGGRIRFDPELNWPDNGNLDKALRLLEPIKAKYGSKLSWGDLIILSGNVAIESMGGPVLGFCGGRIDDADGSASLKLGPSDEQEAIAPCVTEGKQGQCLDVEGTALGTGTVGLIYVNPGGPDGVEGGKDNPIASGDDITRVFGTGMSFEQQETVALVGGGHAFGKAHGACKSPPCGDGKGENTFTSGWEGWWTTNPSEWDNQFFKNLFDFEWELTEAPSGNKQWKPKDGPDIMMLTSDMALGMHPSYKPFSEMYAKDQRALEKDFAKVWYKLVTADMGPSTRCIGYDVPEPQPFQNDLPAAPEVLPNYVPIRAAIEDILDRDDATCDAFINLAYRCASTFRSTDYHGGCNGARIRLSPESEWPENAGTSDALDMLLPVKEKFSASYADMIVLAGKVALERKNKELHLPFCGGYVDADSAHNGKDLSPRHYKKPLITILDDWQVKGLTNEEGVALASRHGDVDSKYYTDLLKAGEGKKDDTELWLIDADKDARILRLTDGAVLYAEALPTSSLNIEAVLSSRASSVTFGYNRKDDFRTERKAPFSLCGDRDGDFRACRQLSIGKHTVTATPEGGSPFSVTFSIEEGEGTNSSRDPSDGDDYNFSDEELAMVKNEELKAIVEKFARKKEALVSTFEEAWTKMMTADRFASNTENACAGADIPTM